MTKTKVVLKSPRDSNDPVRSRINETARRDRTRAPRRRAGKSQASVHRTCSTRRRPRCRRNHIALWETVDIVNVNEGSGIRGVMAVILIVEDEVQVRMLAESYLQEQGHRTLSASTGEEAIAVLESTDDHIDVLFTDVALKDNHQAGLELARQAVERKPHLKVLYVTGQPLTDGMRALFVEGSAVLEKPYTVDQLLTSFAVHFGLGPRR